MINSTLPLEDPKFDHWMSAEKVYGRNSHTPSFFGGQPENASFGKQDNVPSFCEEMDVSQSNQYREVQGIDVHITPEGSFEKSKWKNSTHLQYNSCTRSTVDPQSSTVQKAYQSLIPRNDDLAEVHIVNLEDPPLVDEKRIERSVSQIAFQPSANMFDSINDWRCSKDSSIVDIQNDNQENDEEMDFTSQSHNALQKTQILNVEVTGSLLMDDHKEVLWESNRSSPDFKKAPKDKNFSPKRNYKDFLTPEIL